MAASLVAAFAVVLVAAHGCGWLAARAGQPRVVGELLGAGIVAGPTVLGAVGGGWVPAALHGLCAMDGATAFACLFPPQVQAVVAVPGELGVFAYMLTVGARLDRGLLRSQTHVVARLSAGTALVPLACGLLLLPWLGGSGSHGDAAEPPAATALCVGALLAVTALPVAVRLLDERGWRGTPFGVAVVGTGAVTTVVAFVALLLAAALAGEQRAGVTVWLALPALFACAWACAWCAERVRSGPVWRAAALALAGAVLLGFLARHAGVTVAVGGLLAGAVVPRRVVTAATLDVIERLAVGVLLPLFFAVAGFGLDLRALDTGDLLLATAVVALAIASKFAGAALAGRASGLGLRDAVALGAITNCRGLLVLVVSLRAMELGVADARLHAAAVAVALVTTAMTGPVLRRACPAGEPALPAGRA